MILIIIKAVLIIIAAICKAAVDTISQHPHTSTLTGKFWQLWPHERFVPFTKYPLDGWHLCNSLMIASFIAFGCMPGYLWYVDFPVAGILFLLVFNLFYNKIFQK